MLSVNELKAIGYAIKGHYKGLQLLRNPKGTPGTVVRMLDCGECIDAKTLDTWQRTTRTTIDFSKPEQPLTVENFTVNIYNFFNKMNEKIRAVKGVEYSRINPDGTYIRKEKGYIDRKTLEARDLASLHEPSVSKMVFVPKIYSNDTFNAYQFDTPVEVKKSFAQIEVEKYDNQHYLENIDSYATGRFWKTLWHNIMQK